MSAQLESLRTWLRTRQRVVVAYSGGVDSSLVLAVAVEQLGLNATAVMAVSPSLPRSEREAAIHLARSLGAELALIETQETAAPDYQANPPNRCFFCKDHVYGALESYAREHECSCVVDGMNADDTLDLRPGRAAALRHGIASPLNELGLTKAEVRAAAKAMGLPNWDKPAAACLASRVSYGTPVTNDLLARIEAAEEFVRSLGFEDLRVRHHGDIARVELPAESLARAAERSAELTGGLRALGWTYVTLDLEGRRQGSMNEVLKKRP